MKPAVRPPGTKQILFPVGKVEASQTPLYGDAVVHLQRPAYRPFLPLGLFVWGATPKTYVDRVLVGSQMEGAMTNEPIPARYFETGRSMVELLALAAAGELLLDVEQRRVLEMEVAEVGVNVGVQMRGPFEDVCLWGLTYAQRGPLLTQMIEPTVLAQATEGKPKTGFSGFRGQVIEHHLGGDRIISNVYAPSEESVCRLLVAARHPERMY